MRKISYAIIYVLKNTRVGIQNDGPHFIFSVKKKTFEKPINNFQVRRKKGHWDLEIDPSSFAQSRQHFLPNCPASCRNELKKQRARESYTEAGR